MHRLQKGSLPVLPVGEKSCNHFFCTIVLQERHPGRVSLPFAKHAAIKVLMIGLGSEDVEDFRTEARTIAQLVHPHIVRVFDFGLEGTTPFLVMDYAPHGTLRKLHPKRSRLPLDTVLSYVMQIADALQYAHTHSDPPGH